MHIVELSSTAVAQVDTKGNDASLTQNQRLQCVTQPLTYIEIPRPRDATELNNDGMSKLGFWHPLRKQSRIYQFFRKRFNQRRLQFLFAYSISNWLAVTCFSFWKAFVKCPSLFVNGIYIRRHLHVTMLKCWAKFANVIRWSIRKMPKITKLCLNFSKLCQEY